jgi:hypothetical protein
MDFQQISESAKLMQILSSGQPPGTDQPLRTVEIGLPESQISRHSDAMRACHLMTVGDRYCFYIHSRAAENIYRRQSLDFLETFG